MTSQTSSYVDMQASATRNIPSFKQLLHVSSVLTPLERKISKLLVFGIFLSTLYMGYIFYDQNSVLSAEFGGQYTEALVGGPQYINPILAYSNDIDLDLTRLLYSGLLKRNSGKLELDIASHYDISDDQKTYTFFLRDDIYFHDGKQVTAYDVAFTFSSIQNPQFKSPYYSSFANAKIEIIDEFTVTISLEEPYAPFLDILTIGILPAHIWERIPPMNSTLTDYNLKPIGNGPYEFQSLTKDKLGNLKSYSVRRNKNYYEEGPYINRITFKFYPDFASAINALESKHVNGVSYIPKEYEPIIQKLDYAQVRSLNLPQYTAVFFNPKQNDHLKRKSVRQALAYAIHKQDIIQQALEEKGSIIHFPILEGYIGYTSDIPVYDFNREKAQELLSQAGYTYTQKNDENQDQPLFRQRDGVILEINLATIDTYENRITTSLIAEMWQRIGVKTNIHLIPSYTFQNDILKNRKYDALVFGQIIGSDPDPLPFWHSSQIDAPGLNLSLFANRHVDKLLEEARQTHNPQIRHEKYVEFQKLLNDEIPAIFLYSPTYTYAIDKNIRNFSLHSIIIPADRFSNIHEWYMKTKRTFTW